MSKFVKCLVLQVKTVQLYMGPVMTYNESIEKKLKMKVTMQCLAEIELYRSLYCELVTRSFDWVIVSVYIVADDNHAHMMIASYHKHTDSTQ